MKFNMLLIVAASLFIFDTTGQAAQLNFAPAQSFSTPSMTLNQSSTLPAAPQVQIAARLFTAPTLEPNGFVAVCFATNLDTLARDLVAQIIDSRGVEVTQTSSCGARMAAGVTCDSTALFANNSPLRCVIGTSGNATTLRGGMTTSSGPFPFTSAANQTVPAQ